MFFLSIVQLLLETEFPSFVSLCQNQHQKSLNLNVVSQGKCFSSFFSFFLKQRRMEIRESSRNNWEVLRNRARINRLITIASATGRTIACMRTRMLSKWIYFPAARFSIDTPLADRSLPGWHRLTVKSQPDNLNELRSNLRRTFRSSAIASSRRPRLHRVFFFFFHALINKFIYFTLLINRIRTVSSACRLL